MTKLVLVRHGQGFCNVDRTIEGRATCRGLSELGRQQAQALGLRLTRENFRPDATYASPISRADQTAQIVVRSLTDAQGSNVKITIDEELEEVRPGEAEGMTWDQYFAFYGTTEGWQPNVPFAPGAEAWTQFAARVSRAIDRIAQQHVGQTVLIVTHGGVVDASLFHFFALDPMLQPPIDFETSNTSVTEWERRTFAVHPAQVTPQKPHVSADEASEVHRWRLVRYNDSAHLAGLVTPTTAALRASVT
jgi:2,3-bisphosphoglycerate-dependent phosphoglycerate mutase